MLKQGSWKNVLQKYLSNFGVKMLFSEFVEINPRESLVKGKPYRCVMMDQIIPGHKYVSGEIEKPFKEAPSSER